MSDYTKEYYEKNAEKFIEGTAECDMQRQYDFLEKYLKPGIRILDLGFGSGRDMHYFRNKGYEVCGLDYSKEFCERVRSLGFEEIYCDSVMDMKLDKKVDAIWACASLLHLKRNEILSALSNCHQALNDNGYMYISFKYGDFEGERNGRYFTFMNEDLFKDYYEAAGFAMIDTLISEDVRKDRDEKWFNVILKRK